MEVIRISNRAETKLTLGKASDSDYVLEIEDMSDGEYMIMSLSRSELVRLTSELVAELQPEWEI